MSSKSLFNKVNCKFKLALSGRIFEKDYKENIPLKEFARIASNIGYQGIELRRTQVSLDTPLGKVKEYAKILKDYKLDVVCMAPRGYPVLDDEDVFVQYLELAKEFNCQIIKMGDKRGEANKIRRCAEIAEKYKIKIGLNNHIGTEEVSGIIETIDRTVNYLKEVNHPNFGILYDASHFFISGSEYGPEAINKIKDKIFYVLVQYPVETNIKEATLKFHNRYFKEGIVGESGGPDFNKVFKGLTKINYKGYIGVISPILKGKDSKEVAKLYYHRIKNILKNDY